MHVCNAMSDVCGCYAFDGAGAQCGDLHIGIIRLTTQREIALCTYTMQCRVLCTGAMHAIVLDILNVEYTDHKDIQYGANDPIIANADEIRFDEFEYDVTSVRRTCIQ